MLTKDYTKTGRSCRVTFELPAEVQAEDVTLVGEFNDWDRGATRMKRRKDGSFTKTISLKPGKEYRFRYLLDGDRWVNDYAADRYLPNNHGTDDSVVVV
jgi:1,4-alpha-glucan branching enzyme